jgi:putative Holliday junction resolvase
MAEDHPRILGIDYGEKRIGLAISDPLNITAQPLKLLERTKTGEDLALIKELIEEHGVEKVVIGLPLNMDGSEGFMTDAIRRFSEKLKKIHPIEIIEVDERLTSHQADLSLKTAKIRGKRKKSKIDTISAQIILQTYLDSISS